MNCVECHTDTTLGSSVVVVTVGPLADVSSATMRVPHKRMTALPHPTSSMPVPVREPARRATGTSIWPSCTPRANRRRAHLRQLRERRSQRSVCMSQRARRSPEGHSIRLPRAGRARADVTKRRRPRTTATMPSSTLRRWDPPASRWARVPMTSTMVTYGARTSSARGATTPIWGRSTPTTAQGATAVPTRSQASEARGTRAASRGLPSGTLHAGHAAGSQRRLLQQFAELRLVPHEYRVLLGRDRLLRLPRSGGHGDRSRRSDNHVQRVVELHGNSDDHADRKRQRWRQRGRPHLLHPGRRRCDTGRRGDCPAAGTGSASHTLQYYSVDRAGNVETRPRYLR